ncbi:hypothetical protein [Allokutzneria sp. NRRL B-24872]|uniref:hypothetical protein n=1 Tax=Allokutzneria sp. NRRL B-24872 TaxID=1137961 RepID=UPI000A389AE0|nr:hypothetical protein [Allokutzneria sp. NRRL B-24872]
MPLPRISKLLSVVALAAAVFATPGDPWVALDNQSKESGKFLTGIDFDAANSGWAVGDHTDHNSGKTTAHIRRWDGTKWTDSAAGDLAGKDVSLNQVAAVSATDAWATGVPVAAPEARRATRSPRPHSPLPYRDEQRRFQAGKAAAASEPYVLAHWDGQKWTSVAAPQPGADKSALVTDLERVGDHALAAGYEHKSDPETGVPSEQTPFLDRYAGGKVQRLELPAQLTAKPSAVFSVTGKSADDVWISGAFLTPEKDTPYAAHWDGKAWALSELPVTEAFPNGWNADQVVAMGGTVYVSGRSLYTDGTLTTGYRYDGKTWTEWTERGLAEINDLSVSSDGSNMVAGGWPSVGSNISQYASFDGKAWTSHEQPAAIAGKDGQVLGVAHLPGSDRAMGVGYTNDDSEWGGTYYITASKP